MSWTCATCGGSHEDVPLSFAADYPDNYANMSIEEREQRAIAGSDQCVIDEDQFYVRGCLEIPLLEDDGVFLWGVWARLWKEDYLEIADCWDQVGRENAHGPFKGRLGNSLKQYSSETLNLKLSIKLRPVGERPLFVIADPDHPLGSAQINGMTNQQVHDLVSLLMH
ncbi:MAG TPA: DUF2199 domain-containing protein [Acidobacteriaceae bacterium]|jgi:hypothetical protein|nr:DUF2199 domain-containing protein [Acidobacteriaceae bacterium]